jgi:hypothetical protein
MALAGRHRRARAGGRWIIAGVIITLVILLIDASLHSRSESPRQELATGSWVDQILPLIGQTNQQAQQLDTVWAHAMTMSAATVTSEVSQVATGAASTYEQAAAVRPPTTLAGASGLLDASLLARSKAAAAIRSAIAPQLTKSAPSVASAIRTLGTAATDLEIGDQAYQLFLQTLPKTGVAIPASKWLTGAGPFSGPTASVFVSSLHNSVISTAVHDVRIYSIATSPAPVSTNGSVQVLPDANQIYVTIVVANVGNQDESNLTVTAAISPTLGVTSVRDFVNLAPGQAHTIVGLGPLAPPQGPDVTLTVTVSPPAGSTTPAATQTLIISMPNPNAPPSTTTTTAPPKTTTTVAGGTAGSTTSSSVPAG